MTLQDAMDEQKQKDTAEATTEEEGQETARNGPLWDGERYWYVRDTFAYEIGCEGFRNAIRLQAAGQGLPAPETQDEWDAFQRWLMFEARPDGDTDPSPTPDEIRDICAGAPRPEPPELLGWRMNAFRARTTETVDWLVPGILTRGWTTKLAAREKAGKGTMAYYLLGALERCERTVFGDACVEPTTAVVLTEEPEESIREKLVLFGCERGRVVPGYMVRGRKWEEVVASLVAVALAEDHGVVFVDNISRATGCEDENGTELARSIECLMDALRKHKLAGIIDHHHKKSNANDWDASRGGTATAGATDINVEMFRVKDHPRKRRLAALGRLRACNWEMTIELSEHGSGYTKVEAVSDQAAVPPETLIMLDKIKLAEFPEGVSADEFKDELGKSRNTAVTRLNRLADNGFALKDEATKPHKWFPVTISQSAP